MKEEKLYSDMLLMDPPTSTIHPRMTPEKRAAQFTPFSALAGYEESLENTAKIYEKEMLDLEKGSVLYD